MEPLPLVELPTVPTARLAEPAFRSAHALLLLVFLVSSTAATAAPWRRVWHRFLAPFRAHPILQTRATPCQLGFASCLLPEPVPDSESLPVVADDPDRVVSLQLRTRHGGPFAHHWLELESSTGRITLGYGPATVPFIDAGQISLQDSHGNIERISGMHPLPILALPPANYHYAQAPGAGHPIGKPILLTVGETDALVQKVRHSKFIVPYIPIFHDCRTYVCAVEARAQGRSSLPCYLLFKGYW
jgi:hypothetical protein